MPDLAVTEPTLIDECYVLGGRLAWYSMAGLTQRQLFDTKDPSLQRIVYRRIGPSDKPREKTLCEGSITWADAYHYWSGALTGFTLAREAALGVVADAVQESLRVGL